MKEFVERLFTTVFQVELPVWAKALVALTNVFLILAIAWVLLGVTSRVLRLLNHRMQARSDTVDDRKRVETLVRVFRYIASVVIGAITIMLILAEIGISIAPILATAGVAGLAVGFGAQSLVKDYFTGFVMLLENQIRVGDTVEVSGKTGTVEEVTLRFVRLRDIEGAVHFIPNGVIATVTNHSREFAFALMDIGVAYHQSIDQTFEVMHEVANMLRQDSEYGPKILEPLEIMGVNDWADSSVMLRCRFKVVAMEQGPVRREYLRRLKNAFDAKGIEIPFPCRTIFLRQDAADFNKADAVKPA
jgi:moderate conductance mechanosensitive channel